MIKKIKFYIFIILMLFSVLTIFFVKPTSAFLFKNVIGDCSGRAQFIYNKLYQNKSETDIVFFGSSRTMNGIIDSSITNRKIINLGYCRFGRNLDAFFIEEYLKMHNPKKIVLEVREDEGNNAHPLTPYLLPFSNIAEGFYTLDANVFSNLYNKWLCNLKYIRHTFFSTTKIEIYNSPNELGYWENLSKTDVKQLNEKRVFDSVNLTKLFSKKINRNSAFYFKQLKTICNKHNVRLYFLFIPTYGNVYKKPFYLESYSKYGQCIIPNDSIFSNSANFADYNHLNKKGATSFSLWLNNFFEGK